ncbi:putative aminophospholipid-translocase, partial [Ascosphaera aggregata]
MSSSHGYRSTGTSDPNSDDDGIDLELNLDELDPQTSRRPSFQQQRQPPFRPVGIALRTLRSGARNHGLFSTRRSRSEDRSEDLQGLLEDDVGQEERDHQHDSPLLRPHDAPFNHRRMKVDGDDATLQTRLRNRLQKFSPFRRHSPALSLGNNDGLLVTSSPSADSAPAKDLPSRTVFVGHIQDAKYPPNVISNAKYTPWSFLPRTLYNEFSFFFNIYFLLVALSQLIPVLRIGYLSSYIAPLAFVVSISLGKEAIDDIARRRRDAEANSEEFTVITFLPPLNGNSASRAVEAIKKSRDLRVGDILKLRKDQRFPADVVILKSTSGDLAYTDTPNDFEERAGPKKKGSNSSLLDDEPPSTTPVRSDEREEAEGLGADADFEEGCDTFIRTDQLDGETDWKLRLPSPLTQNISIDQFHHLRITAGPPARNVHNFSGTVELLPEGQGSPTSGTYPLMSLPIQQSPLNIDNTAWASTVLASNTITYAAVIYTGPQTRSAMSTSPSRSKVGLLEYEINNLTKILCILTLSLSVILVALEGFQPTNDKPWYIAIMIYLILFSTIIPMSLRVNLDMAKSMYGRFIEKDQGIPDTVVRTSTIPEDLGRIEYLLSDKTGTLTQNEMELKKIHVGTVSYANEAMDEVAGYVRQGFAVSGFTGNAPSAAAATDATDSGHPSTLITAANVNSNLGNAATPMTRTRREIGSRVRDLVLALALCHNVTPTTEEEGGQKLTRYQASSPDEIAIVRYTENVGLRLVHRDRHTIVLKSVDTGNVAVRVKILDIFPFTSESKRMGIIVQFSHDRQSNRDEMGDSLVEDEDIWFYQKGADTVMSSIVATNDWLDEETANMAREGLRTLVVGRRHLSAEQYHLFATKYKEASLLLQDRDAHMSAVVKQYLESDLELLGVTGVEDKLQKDVKASLELLRDAGVKIWMLTGDKVETARCVAVSSKLIARGQCIHTISQMKDAEAARDALDYVRNKPESALLIDGQSLSLMLSRFKLGFISVAVQLPAVIACRCSPTQKAEVALLIRKFTKKRVCCIGDGGNDVSMIQAADVGIGIVGKEGRQASLAADFSITQFHHLTKLLFWHGRN